MRVYIYFIALLSLLFWGNSSQAAQHSQKQSQHLTAEHQFKPNDTNSLWTLAEDDFDSMEENHSTDKTKQKASLSILNGKLISCVPSQNILLHPLNVRLNSYHTALFYGYSSPIYITHRALRI